MKITIKIKDLLSFKSKNKDSFQNFVQVGERYVRKQPTKSIRKESDNHKEISKLLIKLFEHKNC